MVIDKRGRSCRDLEKSASDQYTESKHLSRCVVVKRAKPKRQNDIGKCANSILTTLLITLASISLAIPNGSVPTVTEYRHLTREGTPTTMPSVVSSADSLQTRLQPSTASAYLNRLIITTLQRRGVDAAEAGVIAEMERLLEHREWSWPVRDPATVFG